PVVTILPRKTVLDAAKLFTMKDIESLIVAWGDEAVGIITEKDIVRRVVAKGLPYSTKIADIMSSPVITIPVGKTGEDAMRLMHEKGVKRLPIVERGKIVGIITATDLVNSLYDMEKIYQPTR
ncbi:MAG: CBS domain-containing protein, partial [archaeon]